MSTITNRFNARKNGFQLGSRDYGTFGYGTNSVVRRP